MPWWVSVLAAEHAFELGRHRRDFANRKPSWADGLQEALAFEEIQYVQNYRNGDAGGFVQ
jgi:hypothetical protein